MHRIFYVFSVVIGVALLCSAAYWAGFKDAEKKTDVLLEAALECGAAKYVCNPKTGEVSLVWNSTSEEPEKVADKKE